MKEEAMKLFMKLFIKLTKEEEAELRQWARDNYIVGEPINKLYHPVVQDECFQMLIEIPEGRNRLTKGKI